MNRSKGRRVVHPESEDRGEQAGALRRRGGRRRVAAGDEGIGPNPDARPIEETTEDNPERGENPKKGPLTSA
jgi:hypothetical protein